MYDDSTSWCHTLKCHTIPEDFLRRRYVLQSLKVIPLTTWLLENPSHVTKPLIAYPYRIRICYQSGIHDQQRGIRLCRYLGGDSTSIRFINVLNRPSRKIKPQWTKLEPNKNKAIQVNKSLEPVLVILGDIEGVRTNSIMIILLNTRHKTSHNLRDSFYYM